MIELLNPSCRQSIFSASDALSSESIIAGVHLLFVKATHLSLEQSHPLSIFHEVCGNSNSG